LENDFTNALVSLLNLSGFEHPTFVESLLTELLGFECRIDTYLVLSGNDGTTDGELSGNACCIWIESKIRSGTLCERQVEQHLNGNDDLNWCGLLRRPEGFRRLILLTPDDGSSNYVRKFVGIDDTHIRHLDWKTLYGFLDRFVKRSPPGTLSELVRQFLERIHRIVFLEDFAGIIQKIDFGKRSEVYADSYLAEIKAGAWTCWNTPRQYKTLDGKGRKLLLYDGTRKAITVEVEILSVKQTAAEAGYPWTNEFVMDSLHVFEEPIPLSQIQTVEGYENFGVHKKDRSAFRNLTHEQYRKLKER
jgi:hypothetical protein